MEKTEQVPSGYKILDGWMVLIDTGDSVIS
jgi:hypothetical protein